MQRNLRGRGDGFSLPAHVFFFLIYVDDSLGVGYHVKPRPVRLGKFSW